MTASNLMPDPFLILLFMAARGCKREATEGTALDGRGARCIFLPMRAYLRLTRSNTYSLLFAVPLLLMYEVGAAWLAAGDDRALRNGADVLLRGLLALGGVTGTMAFTAVLLGAAAFLIAAEQRRRRVRVRVAPFVGMLLESCLYAVALGVVVGGMTQWLIGGFVRLAADPSPVASLSLPEAIVLSLGAGIYEELVFRVLLVGGLLGIFISSGLPRNRAGAFAALLAAMVFSAFHYIGPYGDPWAVPSFLFRFLAGLAFSLLFLVRGFGIAAWTHALYDVALFTIRGL